MSNRLIIIGDIHGCLDELDMLLQKLSLRSEDGLIFIGDLIDRGPDSAGVVKRFAELVQTHGAQLVLGNHEEKFLRYLHHIDTRSGLEKDMKGTDEFPELLNRLSSDEIASLKSAHYSLHLPDVGYLLLHGGTGNETKFPFPKTYRYGEHSPKEFKGLDLLTKIRYLDPNGKFVSLGAEKPEDRYWAETYRGSFGHVIFGHQPFLQDTPKEFAHATGIDTGCVFGGWLSALVLETESRYYISVKARRQYAEVKY
jgi:serine/threonine protein phosphatase 1